MYRGLRFLITHRRRKGLDLMRGKHCFSLVFIYRFGSNHALYSARLPFIMFSGYLDITKTTEKQLLQMSLISYDL